MMNYFKNDIELKHRCELLVYLSMRGELDNIREGIGKFGNILMENEFSFPPFRHYFQISVIDLFDKSELGNIMVHEPVAFSRMLRDIIMAAISKEGYSVRVLPGQIHVPIRFTTFPSVLVPEDKKCHQGLICVRGVVIDKTVATSYIFHSVWKCPEDCPENEVVISGVPRRTLRCQICRSILNEISGLRNCGERLQVTIGGPGVITTKVTVADELTEHIELGYEYIIYGIIKRNMIHAWSVDQSPAYTNVYWDTLMPNFVGKILKGNGKWGKIYKMASIIGRGVCPKYTFMHVKLGLLLSLASLTVGNAKSDDVIHVLVAGIDSQYVGRLMKSAASYANSQVMVSPANSSVSEALVSCSTGLCVLHSPWHTYNGNMTHALRTALESGEFSIGKNDARVRCAVWAHGQDTKKCNINDISSVFGMVYRGDFDDETDLLIDFMLEQASVTHKSSQVKGTEQGLKQYLKNIQRIKVNLEKSAEDLLKDYFLAARKRRTGAVSIRCLSTLINVCKSIARLSGKQVASYADAVSAIWMHAVGMPEPRIIPNKFAKTPENVQEVDRQMDDFGDWLTRFIESVLGIPETPY